MTDIHTHIWISPKNQIGGTGMDYYRERLQSQEMCDGVKLSGSTLKEEQVILLLTFKNASSYL